MIIDIEHTTCYRYARPVQLGAHRLMVRAMEGHDVQIRRSGLEIQPTHRIRWLHDIFGNSVALVEFDAPTAFLHIRSSLRVEQYNTNPFDFVLAPHAVSVPFQYAAEQAPDVAPFLRPHFPAAEEPVRAWLRPYLDAQGRGRTLELFTALNRSMPMFFRYTRREEPGVQSPAETLHRRSGSCRDFALLFMEAARQLGVAARFVSGYLCRAPGGSAPAEAVDATHAWAELYLPGAGWKGFDPTCGALAADFHLRTAVAREPGQATPVSGTFVGEAAAYQGMTVTVRAETSDTQA